MLVLLAAVGHGSANDIALFVLGPEPRRSAVWMTAGVLSVRITRSYEAP
jgi:hypothetical protein